MLDRRLRNRCLALVLLGAAAVHADDGGDPAGTVALEIQAGHSVPISAQPGSNVICDDLSVVTPEFAADGSGFVLRGRKEGTTLCGVWIGDQKPGGLYRVNVVAASGGKDAGAP
jgi:hypothetical protein